MFAQRLSGRHNNLTIAGPTGCVLPPLSACPRPLRCYFGPTDGKEGHPALEPACWSDGGLRLFSMGCHGSSGPDASRRKSSTCARHNTKIIITSRHLPGLFCTGWDWEHVTREKREEEKTKRDGVRPRGYYRDMNKSVRFVLCGGHGRKTRRAQQRMIRGFFLFHCEESLVDEQNLK